MSVATALRQIEADLRAMLSDPEGLDTEVIALAVRRLDAQAEMIELGIDTQEPTQ